jgi:ABC-type antimicrobial peptide transport system permease subunit
MPLAPVFVAVRTAGQEPGTLTASVTDAVHRVDPELPVADVRTLEGRTAGALAAQRFALWLFQAFAALSLTLAAAGVYGLLSYVVRQRRKELGIRVALGARRANLWNMIVADALKMAALGALCSLVMIPVGGSLLRGFLFNVNAFDPYTIGGALGALLGVAVVASLGPALVATKCDPAVALRED